MSSMMVNFSQDVCHTAARQAEESTAYDDMSVPARSPTSTVSCSRPAFERVRQPVQLDAIGP